MSNKDKADELEVDVLDVDTDGHREHPNARDHDMYMDQGNWVVADISGVDRLFVAEKDADGDSIQLGTYGPREAVRIDLDGISSNCDAWPAKKNVCLSVGLSKPMAQKLYSELKSCLEE